MKIAAGSIELLRHIAAPGWRSKAVFSFLYALFRVIRPRKKVVLDNLAIAFPEQGKDRHNELLNGMYRHLSWMAAEQLVLQRDPSMAVQWVDEVEGEEYVRELLRQKRGMVLLTAHFGNWELFLTWGTKHGYPLYTIARGPNDRDIDALLTKYRANCGSKMFERRSDSKTIKLARLLKSGNFVAIAGDVHENDGIDVPFFGRNCKTAVGAASLALLADVPIVPFFLFRKAPFSHKAVIGDPIKVPAEGTRDERVEMMTREINSRIENAVRAEPSIWFWMHRRWKI